MDEQLKEIFEVDSLSDSDKIEDFECWSSLTMICIIAMASAEYKKTIVFKQVIEAETIGGLKILINGT